jgi:hypothetical protein
MKAAGLDALLVWKNDNVRYLSGLRAQIIAGKSAVLNGCLRLPEGPPREGGVVCGAGPDVGSRELGTHRLCLKRPRTLDSRPEIGQFHLGGTLRAARHRYHVRRPAARTPGG